MAETTNKVGVEIEGRDNTGPAIESAKAKLSGLQQTSRRLPESFAKATKAMYALEGVSGSLGGKIASVTGRVSGLGSLIAVGGPFGIAIASVSAAAIAVGASYKYLTQETEIVKSTHEAFEKGLSKVEKTITDTKSRTREYAEELKRVGKTEEQYIRQTIESRITNANVMLKHDQAAYDKLISSRRKLSDQELSNMRELKQVISVDQQLVRGLEEEKTAYEKLTQAKKAESGKAINTEATMLDGIEALRKNLNAQTLEQEKQYIANYLALRRKQIEEEKAIEKNKVDFQNNSLDNFISARAKMYDDQVNMFEASAKKEEQIANETRQAIISTASSMASSMGSAFGALLAGSEDAGKQMQLAVVDAAQSAVMSYAAAAAAGAAASQSAIPIVGPILAGAAAATLFGIVRAYLSQIPSPSSGGSSGDTGGYYSGGNKIRGFAKGGVVPGYGASDTVIAKLTPGETILTREETQYNNTNNNNHKNNIVINFSSAVPASKADAKKVYLRLDKEIAKITSMRRGGLR